MKLLIYLLFPVFLCAQSITGVTGTITDSSSIVIAGSSFGATGPIVILFDDFEDGSNGNAIATGSGSARFGDWNATSGTVTYSNVASVSGDLALRANMSGGWLNYAEVLVPDTTMDIFVSHWCYIPSGDNLPGEGGEGVNWKQMWIQGTGSDDDDQVVPTLTPSSWMLFGNNTPYIDYPGCPYLVKGQWKHFATWIKGGYSSDGEVKLYHLGHTGEIDLYTDDSNVSTMYEGGKRERVRVNGYGRTTSDCHPMFDDVYVAVGANAQARVEIGNNPVYTSCSKITICTPTSWSASSITATINQGAFSAEETAYLFVVDSDGDVSPGYVVTIGGEGSGEAPISGTGSKCDVENIEKE